MASPVETVPLSGDGTTRRARCPAATTDALAQTAVTCCSKPKPQRRLAPPRTLRHTYAADRGLNLTCAGGFDGVGGIGVGTGGGRGSEAAGVTGRRRPKYFLVVLSLSNEADERYELRRLLGAQPPAPLRTALRPHGDGVLQTCFVFDPTPPHGGRRKPGQLYNTRAWLLYEAGRRADMDLTALTANGDSSRPQSLVAMRRDASAHGWQRAAAHANGPSAAEYYAVVTAASLLTQGPAGFSLSARAPAWVPREAAVMAGATYAALRRRRRR